MNKFTINREIIFTSRLNRFLESTKKYPTGAHSFRKPTNTATLDKVDLKCYCIDDSIVNGTREGVLFSFSFSAPLGYEIFEELTSIFFKKVNKETVSDSF